MADQKKLDRWADKLLDTGKRNNLVNFRDTKASTAEVVFPDCESVFSKCSIGHTFEVYDPKISENEDLTLEDETGEDSSDGKAIKKKEPALTKDEYRRTYVPRIRSDRYLLLYAQTPNPLRAVKNIAKKAKEMQDETGINVAYLAFGFVRWKEKEISDIVYRAPLLLVHVNIITGAIVDPVKIEISDDDVVVNPTFSYLLQAEFGMQLPAYEDGETLTSYYVKVAGIVGKLGWDVADECKLGIFSFLKINMYEDIKKNKDTILQNKNVRALLGETDPSSTMAYSAGAECVVGNPLIDLHTVVDADSSQIESIEMAKSGQSFVLQGPPGTGKSQTITNIIAECLHDGKKVLFVSEKQAALNVVYDKLKKAGLADFCLELHSHKANKKAIIDELNRTLEVPKSRVASTASEEIRLKQESQEKLDRYASALHKKRSGIDKSLYQLFEAYSSVRAYPDVNITLSPTSSKGSDYLLRATKLLEQYVEYIPSVGMDYRQNIWYGFKKNNISYEEFNQLKSDLSLLIQELPLLRELTEHISERYATSDLNYQDSKLWQEFLTFCAETDVITPALMSPESLQKVMTDISKLRKLSEEIKPVEKSIVAEYREEIIRDLDGKGLHEALTSKFSGGFSRLISSEYKGMLAKVQAYSRKGQKLKHHELLDITNRLMQMQSLLQTYAQQEADLPTFIGRCYSGYYTDWDHVVLAIQSMQKYLEHQALRDGIPQHMSAAAFAEAQSQFGEDAASLREATRKVRDAISRVSQLFDHAQFNIEEESFSHCTEKIRHCFAEMDMLSNWTRFMNLIDELKGVGLLEFVHTAIGHQIKPQNIVGAYQKAYYKQWIDFTIYSDPELSSFERIKQDQNVRTFVEKDNLQYQISKAQIKSELSLKRPSLDMVAGGSAVAILRREGQKKRKQLPIRKLLAETGNLVQIIKPCFLMSPLSVSTFLEPDKISFDTIVFDEASQIFPQDAIGAIYRGKQLIVVGDWKQMPPSNFFNASTDVEDEDEEIGDVTDFESILDICSSVFTTERLAWHYRSHYEQLIAFSNANFYNNNLVTFPSSTTDHKGIGVDYYYISNGVFDRKSKTNMAEAKYIVNLIFNNIDQYPNRSLGVVAFSVAQQNLIDTLLSKRRESDPSYEWFFSEERPEPFFIKNLETVQGDERDTIIFSIAYAKDSTGRFILNFGPLNREGGERRLNVAVTRAKDNIQLVSSIHYTDINLNNSRSEGVRLLRAYLDYAQNGEEALERAISVSGEDEFDSYFEQEVCDFLRDRGFTVDTQVGCSGYRIDLGLRRPDSSNYLLAIECDGATYHSSKNARDRDSLRQRVLENMGWQFYRIWSTDWYKNKAVEKERLLDAAKKALQRENGEGEKAAATNSPQADMDKPIAGEESQFVKEEKPTRLVFPEYKQVDAVSVILRHGFSFYDFQDGIKEILQTEAPLSEEYLLKRIVGLFDREKVTKVVIDAFHKKMYRCEQKGIIRRDGFLYLEGTNTYVLRVPGVQRDVKYISIEELAVGFLVLIKQNISATRDGLYKTMTNKLGFSRTGDVIVARYETALQLLIQNHLVIETSDGLSAREV